MILRMTLSSSRDILEAHDETKEPGSGADPFTQLKGSHLRIVLIFRIRVNSFDRQIPLCATGGIFEMDLPAEVSLTQVE
jgi:hypothetical protein